ncbi:MAG TPA: response regulator transcription factor [Ramlibacter sp.]|nr:response regulator transcription factor [Ramlibacter sp.]
MLAPQRGAVVPDRLSAFAAVSTPDWSDPGDGLRTLIVQEDGADRATVAGVIARLGWDAQSVDNPLDAWVAISTGCFDVVLVDLASTGREGLDLVARVRRRTPGHRDGGKSGVLVLGPAWDTRLRLDAFNLGADAFVPHPAHPAEIRAVLSALARRRARKPDAPSIGDADLSVRDMALLRALLAGRPGVVSRSQLHAALELSGRSNAIEVSIHVLRRKLGRSAIETVRGQGYRISRSFEWR